MAKATKEKTAGKAPKFKPPAVVCRSLEDADELLRQWSELLALEAQAKLAKSEATKKAAAEFKAALFVEFPPANDSPGGKVSFADRIAQFESAIRAYAEKHRDRILLDKLKSRKLEFGAIGWEKADDSIAEYSGQPKEGNAAILEELETHLRESLSSYEELPAELLDCLTIKITWSREAIAKALELKKVTRDDVRKIGFKFEEGQDEFFARPTKPSGKSIETVADAE